MFSRPSELSQRAGQGACACCRLLPAGQCVDGPDEVSTLVIEYVLV